MTDLNDINYRPLDGLKHAWSHIMKTGLDGWCWALFIGLTSIGIGLAALTKNINALLILDGAFLAYYVSAVSRYKNQLWSQFAAVNGWAIDATTPLATVLPPSLMFGHSPDFSPVIQAKISDLVFDMYTYNCTVGYGKNSHTYYFTVAMTTLPKQMPHMVLNSKKAKVSYHSDIPNARTLKLEGDFNDYFSLQIEQGQEIDVLTIITPDVMQALVDYGQAEDIEILGNNLYFMVGGDKRNVENVRQLILSVAELSVQLKENARLSTPAPFTSMPAPQPMTSAPTVPSSPVAV